MMARECGQCPRCETVTFRTEGECESKRCMPGESQLRRVKNCQWIERATRDECFECENCGQVVSPMPEGISPLRACRGE